MRAIQLSAFGPPETLELVELPDPRPGPGQVVVGVAYVGVTFVDTQIRAGRPPSPAMLPALPTIPGNGVGGVVRALGPGADPDLAGARVIATTGGRGACAEQVAVEAEALVRVPDGLGLAAATALLADGRTALGLVEAGAPRPGERVLVEAAGGGVGTLLVQLARAAGAEVVAAARGAGKLALARELGAAETVDYGAADWARGLAPVDLALDGVGGAIGRAAFELVRPGGRFLRFGMASGAFAAVADEEAAARGVALLTPAPPTPRQLRERAAAALALAAEGRLRPIVGQIEPLARAAAAHAAIERRATVGKTLLRA